MLKNSAENFYRATAKIRHIRANDLAGSAHILWIRLCASMTPHVYVVVL